jgi:HSP20 family protein
MTRLIKYNRGQYPTVSREAFSSLFDVDRIFDEIFGPEFAKSFGVEFFDKQAYPRIDVVDIGDSVSIEAEIPGLTKHDVSVDVENYVLTIKGNKQLKSEADDEKTYIRREIKRSSFSRSLTLDEGYDVDKISADFDHGILKVNVPKRKEIIERCKKRKIL